MPNFTSSTVLPGTYFQLESQPAPTLPSGLFIPTIIGTGSSNKQVQFAIQRGSSGSIDTLLTAGQVASGISVVSIVSVLDAYGLSYIQNVNYNLVTNADTSVSIVWQLGANQPSPSVVYFVVFNTPKLSADYNPIQYTSNQIVNLQNFYGLSSPLLNNLGQFQGMNNSLTTGASLAFDNGSAALYACQLNPLDAQGNSLDSDLGMLLAIEAALAKISNISTQCVVPLFATSGSAVLTDYLGALLNHVTVSNSTIVGQYRTAFVGGAIGTDQSADPVAIYSAMASQLNNQFMAVIAPSTLQIAVSGQPTIVDGSFLAAALAGQYTNANFDVATPITNAAIQGFYSIQNPLSITQYKQLVAAGVTVVNNNNVIVQALSTNPSSVQTAELKISRIIIYTIRTVSTAVNSIFGRSKSLGASTASSIASVVNNLLNQLVRANILVSFVPATVSQNASDPREYDVVFQILPVYDVDYVFVQFGVTI